MRRRHRAPRRFRPRCGLDRTAVEHAHLPARFAEGGDQAADRSVHFADVGGRRRPCRCRSPRSARRRSKARGSAGASGSDGIELGADVRDRVALSRTASLSPTHRITPSPASSAAVGLGADVGVAFMLVLAALAVADDGQRRACIDQHRRRDAAGVRAAGVGVDVLPADGEAARAFDRAADQRRRQAQSDIDRHRAFGGAARSPSTSPRSAAVPFIFQLPAINRRLVISSPVSGQRLLAAPRPAPKAARPKHQSASPHYAHFFP